MSTMNFHLRLWKQKSAADQGEFIEIHATEIPSECSFLEMLDIVNNRLTRRVRSRSPLPAIVARAFAEPVTW